MFLQLPAVATLSLQKDLEACLIWGLGRSRQLWNRQIPVPRRRMTKLEAEKITAYVVFSLCPRLLLKEGADHRVFRFTDETLSSLALVTNET